MPQALQTVTFSPSMSAFRQRDVLEVWHIWQLFVGSAILPFLERGVFGALVGLDTLRTGVLTALVEGEDIEG